MRVLVVDTYYPTFLSAHYAENRGLAERSYAEQLLSLLSRSFGTFDAYSSHFRALGHESRELIVNCPELQLRWASENGLHGISKALRLGPSAPGRLGAAASRMLLRRIALAQVAEFDPDVVYVQDLWFFSRRDLETIRRQGRLLAAQIASEPPGEMLLKGYDVIFTSFPHFVERFLRSGIESEFLQIAFDERLLSRLRADSDGARRHGVAFVGGLNPATHAHGVRLLEDLARALPLEVWGYGADALPSGSRLRERFKGEAWGLDMYMILAASKIVVNRHIDVAEGYANNMRLFEATGMGALLLTEAAPNLTAYFEPGREVVTYHDSADLIAQVRHYLGREEERLAIAAAGQTRTLRDHTYATVIAHLAERLELRLNQR